MVGTHDFLMMTAVDETGMSRAGISGALLTEDCAHRLIGADRPASGAVVEPNAVLEALAGYQPGDRESRSEYSALLELALVADAYGLVLRLGESDPTTWTPAHDPRYWTTEVQTALSFIAAQLDCTVEQASHRLFALVDSTGACLIEVSRDVATGRLTFIGDHAASTTSTSSPRRS